MSERLVAAELTDAQQETIRFFQGYNVTAQWFVGEAKGGGIVEVIALGDGFVWSFLINPDGSQTNSEAKVEEFETGITI